MKRVRVGLALAVLLACCGGYQADTETPAEQADLELGRKYAGQFNRGELAELQSAFSPDMKATFSLEELDNQRRRMQQDFGEEVEVLDERVQTKGEYTLYLRKARFDKSEKPLEVQWGWDASGTVVGFMIRQASE